MNHVHKSWDNLRYSGSAKNCPAWHIEHNAVTFSTQAKSTCVISLKSLQHFSLVEFDIKLQINHANLKHETRTSFAEEEVHWQQQTTSNITEDIRVL